MALDEFANITRQVVAGDGFDAYAPTAIYPGRAHLQVLSGVPASEDIEKVAVDWALKDAQNGEEYLVAFKIGINRFKIIRRIGHYSEDEILKSDRS